jgi:glycolate oxidase
MPAEEEVVARLRLICGETHVLSSPAELAAYTQAGHEPPAVVVVPGTATEVAAAIKACNAAALGFVARGAGTPGPDRAAVVIALARLRRIVTVNRAAGSVTVEAGAPIGAVRQLLPEGLIVFPELTDAKVGTVGGALASGFGLGSLIELELVTAGGAVVRLDREGPGYDLAGAFVGSGGADAIAVRARLRMSRAANLNAADEAAADG